jgi:methylglutaconyl-CoA hydratase
MPYSKSPDTSSGLFLFQTQQRIFETMSLVLNHLENGIRVLTLNRPEKRNALNPALVEALTQSLRRSIEDDATKIILLKANGSAFCAGADLEYIQQLQEFSYEENLQDSKRLANLFELIYTSPKVVVSLVNGPALAGGCGLATIADFCFATPDSIFGYTEARIGFIPALVKVFLLRKIGEGKARGILLTAEIFKAQRALDLGLIHQVVAPEEIEASAYQFCTDLIQQNSAMSMAAIKQMFAELPKATLQEGLQYATTLNAKMRESEDCKKGIQSFLNKEKPSWNNDAD